MNDQKIIDWLKNNSVESKEELYEQFPGISTTLLDHHLNNINPSYILKTEANEKTNFEPQSQSQRAVIIKYVCANPDVSNKKLYEIFSDKTTESTIRNYKHAALLKMKAYFEERGVNEEDDDEELEKTFQEKQSQPTQKTLVLEDLEKKAYGQPPQENKPKNILNNDALLNQLIEAKIKPLQERISEQTECIDILTEELDGLNKNISKMVKKQVEASLGDQLDKLIEDKFNQIITRKLSDVGGKLLGGVLGNLLGNTNLNINFGKK